jgi:prepilin-type N-terminal cleavage/methylation domain-containing protein
MTMTELRKRQSGFTLLEVLVALTITAMVLGSLFALAAGSKQLAFRSSASLGLAIQARAAINFAVLQDEYGDVEEIIAPGRFEIRGNEYLDAVPRKTEPIIYKLQSYAVIDEETDESITGTRWVKLELPE